MTDYTRPTIIAIEGSIGAGKSTILVELEKLYFTQNRKDVVVMREPVDVWNAVCDEDGENIIQKFYKDPKKYSFAFQTLICNTIVQEMNRIITDNPKCTTIICERSLCASKYVFAKMLHDDNLFEKTLYDIYSMAFNQFAQGYVANKIVYMDCPPVSCLSRINKRRRLGEDNISLEYLIKCENYYVSWLSSIKVPRIVIDVKRDIDISGDIYASYIREIDDFIFGHSS
jgi:deoxyadenosine/deoxycytidine kinase